jgi:hypothetical protein
MLTVINGMHHLMHQGVENGNRVFKCRADKNLVDAGRTGSPGPALSDVARPDTGTGKAAGWVAVGNGIALFFKDGCERLDSVRKPSFAVQFEVAHGASNWSGQLNAYNCEMTLCDNSDYDSSGVSRREIDENPHFSITFAFICFLNSLFGAAQPEYWSVSNS